MHARSSFETNVLAAFAAAVLVVAVLAATTWKVSEDSVEAALQVSRTHEMLDSLAHTRGETLLIELSTQSYRISGDAGRLAERDVAISARETLLPRIKELTADNARQQERWTRLREAADERLAISRRAVLLRETEGLEAANAYVASAPVRETRERLFQVLREMEEEERRLLEERVAAQLRARQITIAAAALAALALVVLLAATYFLIRRQMRATEAARRALTESEERHRAIVDTAVDGIVVIDERGAIQRFNPGAERMFGYPEAEVAGKNVSVLMPSPYRDEHDGYLAKFLATGEKRIIGIGREVVARRKDGAEFPVHIAVAEMRRGESRMFTGIIRDITEARRAAERQAHLVTSLEAANKELESFSYSVSHDLRSPLRAIDGFSRILGGDYADRLDDEGRRLLGVIRDSTQRMGRLIDDLLEFSRLGRKPLAAGQIDMKRLVAEVLEELQVAGGQRPRLVLGALPPAHGDTTLVKQAWLNLLANAIKFSGKREQPVIEVSGREDGAESVYCVKDNGAGFDMRYYDKLFDVFQRLHGDEEFSGSGVGLAIVRRVVTRHGGRVWAEGKVNEGATFYFALPKEGGA